MISNENRNENYLDLFEGITDNVRDRLMENAVIHTKKKNTYLFKEGEKVDRVWRISKGQVKLSKYDGEGHEQIIGIFSEEDAIWEGLFLKDSTYPYSAVCLTNVEVSSILTKDFSAALVSEPKAMMRIIEMLSKKLHDANERNIILSKKDPKAKIAGLLIYRKERTSNEEIYLKLEDIAASVNLRPETVSRKLREIENDGIIERKGHGRIRIIDFSSLMEIYSN